MHWNRFLLAASLISLVFLLVPEVFSQTTPFVHKKRYAMGTVFEIVAYSDSAGRASSAIDQALDEVIRLDNVMSNFKPESDLSQMNREAHFHAARIPADLYKVIETSLAYSRLSGGEYDVSIGPVVDLWKAALAGGATPTAAEQAQARSCVGYEKIELIAPDQIEFHSDCMRVDLGSIGKGYAVDRAMAILRSSGIERAYIDAGGSTIYGMGTPPGRDGWLVHLRDPSNRLDPQVKLISNSVSTSEQTAASTLTGDAPGHIVVPGSGKPLRTRYVVSVTAKSATASDALSTTLLLLGPEKGAVLVSRLKDVTAIWVSADGQKTIAGSETTIAVRESGEQATAASVDHVAPAAGKVLLRVAAGPLPAVKAMGVSEVVLQWPVRDAASLAELRALGFRVFLEAGSNDLAAAAIGAERANLAGVIVDHMGSDAAANNETFRSTKAAHPKLLFRFLISGGKQPQMRGRLVVDRDGILQVSSPSSQPWLDTNLAVVRLAETFHPDEAPALYDFHWDLSDAVHKEHGPSAEEYALAISEAEAIRADVIVDVPESLQKALVANQAAAWTLWNQVKQYIAFSSAAVADGIRPIANMGIITCDDQTNYEAVNLLARHNLTLEIVGPQDLNGERLNRWNALVVFCASRNPEIGLFVDFAKRGGIVVLVNQRGDYLWHSNTPARQDEHSATFTVGSGEIVELREPISDPEIFARDLRRLIGAERSVLSLWNSLTTLVTGYRQESTGETILNVINYADVPNNVQVQIKGRFASVQLESPEEGCCLPLRSFEHGGFTEFTIPRLVVAARVHLKSADIGSVRR